MFQLFAVSGSETVTNKRFPLMHARFLSKVLQNWSHDCMFKAHGPPDASQPIRWELEGNLQRIRELTQTPGSGAATTQWMPSLWSHSGGQVSRCVAPSHSCSCLTTAGHDMSRMNPSNLIFVMRSYMTCFGFWGSLKHSGSSSVEQTAQQEAYTHSSLKRKYRHVFTKRLIERL